MSKEIEAQEAVKEVKETIVKKAVKKLGTVKQFTKKNWKKILIVSGVTVGAVVIAKEIKDGKIDLKNIVDHAKDAK